MTRTQLDLLAGLKRPALEDLAKAWAKRFGTKAQQRTALSKLKVEDLRDLIRDLAARAHKGRKVHIAAVDVLPACMTEAQIEKAGVDVLLLPTALDGDHVTCAMCRQEAGLDLPRDERDAEEEEEEIARALEPAHDLEPAQPTRTKARAAKERKPAVRAQGEIRGVPAQGIAIKFERPRFDEVHHGRLLPTGQVEVAGVIYKSPSAAARLLAGGAINGWKAWKVSASGAEIDVFRKGSVK